MMPIGLSQPMYRSQQPLRKPKLLFCTNLRTCGLIIAYVDLISCIILLYVCLTYGTSILLPFVKLVSAGLLLTGIYQKKPNYLIPALTQYFFSIAGAITVFMFLLNKPSDDKMFEGHKTAYISGAAFAIAILVYEWVVTHTLYHEYTFFKESEKF